MLDHEMIERIRTIARRTWDAIGDDCFINEDGERDESVIISRDTVVELVCDAGRMKMYGDDDEAYEAVMALSYERRQELMKSFFGYESYGY